MGMLSTMDGSDLHFQNAFQLFQFALLLLDFVFGRLYFAKQIPGYVWNGILILVATRIVTEAKYQTNVVEMSTKLLILDWQVGEKMRRSALVW